MSQQSAQATADAQLIYLDYNASAPLRPEALEAMLPHLRSVGNASSIHAFGRDAERAVSAARGQLADLLECSPRELIFTSGATEANNLALRLGSSRGGIATSTVEHPAVLEAAHVLADNMQCTVVEIGVDPHGRLDLEALEAALVRGGIGLVSVMMANNETGVIADLPGIIELAHRRGALVHTDATQAVGRVRVDLARLDLDLLSLSAHKFGGPQGVGALFIRRSARIEQRPLLIGGGHERGWRAGTTNVAGVVGMGAAAEVCRLEMRTEGPRISELRDGLEAALTTKVPDAWVNGQGVARLPGTTSITFRGAPADAVMTAMPAVAVSDGSACHAGAPSPSHVLIAMGLDRDDADSTLRFSLGYATSASEIDLAITATTQAVSDVRSLLLPQQPAGSLVSTPHLVNRSAPLHHEGS